MKMLLTQARSLSSVRRRNPPSALRLCDIRLPVAAEPLGFASGISGRSRPSAGDDPALSGIVGVIVHASVTAGLQQAGGGLHLVIAVFQQ